jgi:hypothetical protein
VKLDWPFLGSVGALLLAAIGVVAKVLIVIYATYAMFAGLPFPDGLFWVLLILAVLA